MRRVWCRFSGLTIIHTAKKNVREVIERRMIADAKKHNKVLNHNQERQLKDKADKIGTTMDLHSVKLKFEAFVERNGCEEEICPPVYSNEIQNLSQSPHLSKTPFHSFCPLKRLVIFHIFSQLLM